LKSNQIKNMEVTVYTQEGKKKGVTNLPEDIFGVKWNADLVSQVLFSQASNRRAGTADTKDRSEVSGGGKKPWNQKGTGQARHGSSRSPIWRHGGVTHGPMSIKNYKKVLPRGMKNAALFSLLSAKLKSGKILFVDNLADISGKTKSAEVIMKNLAKNVEGFSTLAYKKKGNVYMTTPKMDMLSKRSFRNLPYVTLHNVEDLNPLDIANARYLVISNPEKTVEYISAKK
jgi:large subunit ribosomal protein L4